MGTLGGAPTARVRALLDAGFRTGFFLVSFAGIAASNVDAHNGQGVVPITLGVLRSLSTSEPRVFRYRCSSSLRTGCVRLGACGVSTWLSSHATACTVLGLLGIKKT